MELGLIGIEEFLGRPSGHYQRLHRFEVGLPVFHDVPQIDAAVLVFVSTINALVSHGDYRHQFRSFPLDGVDGGLGDHKGSQEYLRGVHSCRYSHRAGPGGLDQGLFCQVDLGYLMGRVSEIEAVGTLTTHLAHQEVAQALAVQRQRFLGLGHQSDLLDPVVEGDGRRGKRPEHVDYNCRPLGFLGVTRQATESNFHVAVCSL